MGFRFSFYFFTLYFHHFFLFTGTRMLLLILYYRERRAIVVLHCGRVVDILTCNEFKKTRKSIVTVQNDSNTIDLNVVIHGLTDLIIKEYFE